MELCENMFNEMCRACLCKSPNMKSLYTKVAGEERFLMELLASTANITISIEDKLPKQVCCDCESMICKADAFRRRCLESNEILNGYCETKQTCPNLEDSKKHEIKSEKDNSCVPHYEVNIEYSNLCNKSQIFNELTSCFSTDNNEHESSKSATLKDTDDIKTVKIELGDVLDPQDLFCNDFDDQEISIEYSIDSETKPPKIYPCHCGLIFDTKETYKKHSKLANCNKNKKLTKKQSHIDTIIPIKNKIPCKHCQKQFSTVHAWKVHQHTHKDTCEIIKKLKYQPSNESFQCSLCFRKFKTKKSLSRHIKRHEETANIKHTCERCKREFKYKAYLESHILTVHSIGKGVACEYCLKEFVDQSSLEVHRDGHKIEKKHTCNVCNKSFLMLCTLKEHMRTHTGEKPFLCSQCGRGFSQKSNLAQHMRRHQGLKAYNCDSCEKRFVSKGELEAHARKHTGAHPFVCDDCGNGFTTSSALVKHRRIHTGERPYACDICSMKFAASGTLKNHRRIHTGERPFQCSHCEKAFVQRNDLISHIRCHTGERPYVCNQCGHAFRKAAALKAHIRMHGKANVPVNMLMGGMRMCDEQ